MQLILDKPGTFLSVKNGMLHISNEEGQRDIPVDKVSSVHLSKAVAVTSEALMLAVENEIEVLLIDRRGNPIARLWSNKYGSVATIRKNQLAFSQNKEAASWIKNLLAKKMDNMTALLLILVSPGRENEKDIHTVINDLEKIKEKILQEPGDTVPEIAAALRGYEGSASRKYFQCISSYLPEQYRFESRSQHPAYDMFNCLLNYAYGMLYGKCEGALIRAGIDPYVGILHRDEYNRPVMVYDFIEQFRVWADYTVIHLCMQQVIFPDFFDIENGTFFLNSSGKRILIQSFNDYLDEVVTISGLERSRNTHIDLAAQNLATMLKNFLTPR